MSVASTNEHVVDGCAAVGERSICAEGIPQGVLERMEVRMPV